MRRVSVLVAAIAIAGCNRRPHVTLTAPPPTAALHERVAAFNALRPVAGEVVTHTSCSSRGGCSSTITSSVTLANGTTVHHADDLVPVVTPASESGQAIARMHAKRERASMWGKIAAAGLLGGIGGAVLLSEVGASDSIAGGVVIAGLVTFLVGIGGRQWNRRDASYAEIDAFERYDVSLARRLELCVQGLAVAACGAAAPGAPGDTLTPTDPALRSLQQR